MKILDAEIDDVEVTVTYLGTASKVHFVLPLVHVAHYSNEQILLCTHATT